MRRECSVLNPVITIECVGSEVPNYIEIKEFNRKYFVTNVVSVRQNLWELHCHVDVLSTYADAIKKLSGIIARQENNYNLYLDDDKFLVDCKRIYWTKAFPNRVVAGNDPNAIPFIITLAGGENTQSSSSSSSTELPDKAGE